MTLAGFAETFLTFTATRCKATTVAEYRGILARYLLPRLGSRDLRRISTADLAQLHASLKHVPVRANRAVCALARILKVARLHSFSTQLVERPPLYRERQRTRFLSRDEASALLARLDREPSISAKALALILQTGLRKSEALNLRWSEVDLEHRLLSLVDTKTGPSIRPLSRGAVATLAGIPRVGDFVFPGSGTTGRLVMVERVWHRIRAELGLHDVCIHSLRHSHASLLVAAGVPLYTVSKILGHSTLTQTARYAHLAPGHLVDAVDKVKL